MKIKVLGTRGEIKASAPRYFYHSGILVDNKILFDIGEEKFLDYKPKWIFIIQLNSFVLKIYLSYFICAFWKLVLQRYQAISKENY